MLTELLFRIKKQSDIGISFRFFLPIEITPGTQYNINKAERIHI